MAITPKISPTPNNVPQFAYEFVNRMRNHEEVRAKPSIRQTQSIPMLLSARYFRNGRLTLDDFIDAAVYTTYPPDQKIARIVAEDIVLGRQLRRKQPDGPTIEKIRQKRKKQVNDRLEQVLAQIKREQELAKTIKKEKVQQGFEYLQDLRSRDDSSLYEAALLHLKEGDIVLRGISNDEELKAEAASELFDKYGGLTSKEIQSSEELDVLDQVCDNASAAEQLAARALRGDKDIDDLFSQLAERDPSTAARALRLMEEMKKPGKKQREAMDKTLQEAIDDLSQVKDYSSELGRVPKNISEHIQDAPTQFSLADAMEFAKEIGAHTKKDYTQELLQSYDEQFNQGASRNVDMRQLAETAREDESWHSLVQKKTQENIENAQARSSPSDFLRQHLAELENLRKQIPDRETQATWDKTMQAVADAAVASSPTRTHLRQTVRSCSRMGTIPSQDAIRDAGGRLGLSEAEILELLNPSFRVIKQLIQQGVSDFERLQNLVSSAGLSYKQLKELADIATEHGNQAALGSIAHENLQAALGQITDRSYGGRGGSNFDTPTGKPDADRAEMVFGGLLGGPATSIVKMWYSYRDELPPELKERLRRITKRLLIDLGMRFAKQTMGTSMLGGIQLSTSVRPYRLGDDMDLIDLEETIDNLLSKGITSFDIIEPEDFRVVETYQGHRCFVWALDKSGSMDSAEKLGMLAISVMAGLYAVQRDDFGVVLFDHQTHIVKKVPEKAVSIEKVASDLLDAKAGGGTGAAHTMKWALRNFEDTRAKEKVFILNTDMFLSDQQECESLAKEMKRQDIKLILIVPKSSYNPQAADALAKAGHGVVLDIGSIEELPERLLRVTNY